MQVDISSRVRSVSADLRERIERHLAFAFDRFAARIRRVVVRLSDINGTRGGVDKVCSLNIEMVGSSGLRLESISTNWDAAAYSAAHRATLAISRQLRRQRDHHR